MGVVSIVTGLAGALASAILWIYRIPEAVLGKYASEVAHGGPLADSSGPGRGPRPDGGPVLDHDLVLGRGRGGYFIGLISGSWRCPTRCSRG